jgi:hypothetical protein
MQAFFCVALFRHLEPVIIEQTQVERLTEYLLTTPIIGFSASENMPFIRELDAEWPTDADAFAF